MKKMIWTAAILCTSLFVQAGTVTYTFDETNVYDPAVTNLSGVTVSTISYMQGTSASGGGVSAVAYESNVPGDNLFAMSSRDIDSANLAYQNNDSRFEFSLTADAGGEIDFSNASFSMDLFALNASTTAIYIVNSRAFYNINGGGWTNLPITGPNADFYQIVAAASDTPDHILNTLLFDASTGSNLVGSINAEAKVFKTNFSVDMDAVGTLEAGDEVEFAVFVWDNATSHLFFYAGVDNIEIDNVGSAVTLPTENNAAVNFTFDESNALAAATSGEMEDTVVSAISYVQGTSASGAGDSAVAYESNVPEDNLFAISSRDIDGANAAYQPNDSRFEFSLTAGKKGLFFNNGEFSFDLIAMNASESYYNVFSRMFYSVNGGDWTVLPVSAEDYYAVRTGPIYTGDVDHILNTNLFADVTDELLVYSVDAEADVYTQTFTSDMSGIGILEAGDEVEFALFVWDNRDGNLAHYAGVDNVKIDLAYGGDAVPPAIGDITLEILPNGTNYVLSWLSAAGFSYGVEDLSEMSSTNWLSEATGLPGNDGTLSHTGTVSESQNFFRVIAE
jgi:hypothetical protein